MSSAITTSAQQECRLRRKDVLIVIAVEHRHLVLLFLIMLQIGSGSFPTYDSPPARTTVGERDLDSEVDVAHSLFGGATEPTLPDLPGGT